MEQVVAPDQKPMGAPRATGALNFLFYFVVKWDPSPKIVAQIRGVFVLEGGNPGAPQTSALPWANPRYVPGLGA